MSRAYESTEQKAGYHTEHWLAWALALAAVVLGVIGVLSAFGVVPEVNTVTTPAQGQDFRLDTIGVSFWEALVWLLPAVAFAMLSTALHRTDHHRMGMADRRSDAEGGMWKTEHGLAYLMAIVSIVASILALLVGFDVFDQGWAPTDGIIWAIAGIGTAALTQTLHAVRHHQTVADEDYIVGIVERRVGMPGTTMPGTTIVPEHRTSSR